MSSEIIFYNGFTFRRYPNSKRRSDKVYFSGWVNGKKKRLHRYKYETEIGVIEKGYHIHHLDENPLNNDLSNLESKLGKQHISDHYKALSKNEKDKITKIFIDSTNEKAKEWHKSKEGIEWHKENAKNQGFGKFNFGKSNCLECEKEFDLNTKSAKFCSNKCKSSHRRKSGVDNEKRECKICNSEFETNKYSKILKCKNCK